MKSPGKRRFRGTSVILSLVFSGRPVVTTLNYSDQEIPPRPRSEGIDLVTEIVLTLTKTNKLLRQAVTKRSIPHYFKVSMKRTARPSWQNFCWKTTPPQSFYRDCERARHIKIPIYRRISASKLRHLLLLPEDYEATGQTNCSFIIDLSAIQHHYGVRQETGKMIHFTNDATQLKYDGADKVAQYAF